ncbi:uracil-DNA glycosylase family protein [Vibrio vulnificus]|uniref:uracil-DNA glycosylase family protein n=1 Tax=Vibrio vulnificus TaxID=672 RepID=UPI000315959A|nr:uracil-DNA glycosylase family protein [Vibrio vulnificus]ASM96461.1 IclR family transcriptional regulator [Vibrio vulnificus NBRC 15645 = ATCC 27562]EGQ8001084.1 uracil-DNA glycosylase family protein [Vibrio vulnificus]EGQ9292270.1 uracil-DNA glycosylase family protein [Vibrio vulnificus]EIV8496906.1 uracil-DNA glycosylase family protein [Vibrio vulnificus]EIX4875321.1 uracil-DNA glycosylase family protein [Vibrio vulnificus]
MPLEPLLTQIRACQVCASALPLGANPVVQAHSEAKILIIGQAPGTKVHHTSIPWNDASGNRLRAWLDIEKQTFYDPKQIAIMPMGFCYPGQGQSGDLPPRKECAPLWHEALLKHLPNIELTLLIGQYAQNRYLSNKPKTVTETVQNWQAWLPDYLPLPHPSPRNTLWLRKNPWFEEQTVPYLRQQVHQRLSLSKVER